MAMMNWYAGDIAKAVAQAKTLNAVFVVFIQGKDEMSEKLTRIIDEPEVRNRLERNDFVAIKIEGDSQAYVQFMSIYKVVPVPSIFFIGNSGTPLDIATGVIANAAELVLKIDTVLVTAGKRNATETPIASGMSTPPSTASPVASPSASATLIAAEQATVGSAAKPGYTCSGGVCVRNKAGDDCSETNSQSSKGESEKKEEQPTSSSSAVQETTAAANTMAAAIAVAAVNPNTAAPAVPIALVNNVVSPVQAVPVSQQQPLVDGDLTNSEARMAHVTKIVEDRRKELETAKLKEEKENELRRRKEGKDQQTVQNWQREQELRDLQESIRRERLAAQEERDRIRAQIAADRAERAQANRAFDLKSQAAAAAAASSSSANDTQLASVGLGAAVTQQTSSAASSPNETRLQFRLPGGINKTRAFQISEPLSVVRSYVVAELLPETGITNFSLATTYPRREFNVDDDVKTLSDLNLVPNAVLLVLSQDRANVVERSGGLLNMLATVVWAVLTPAAMAFNYIRNIGFGGLAQRFNQRLTALGWKRPPGDYTVVDADVAQRRNLDAFMRPPPGSGPQPSTTDGVNSASQTQDKSATTSSAAKDVLIIKTEAQPDVAKRNNYSGEATIHRLRDTAKDNEDDNATYNGNSTQQQ